MASSASALTENNVPRQDGRIFLVVGGDVGSGYELCRMLYRTGARVYMTSPSEDRAASAIRSIHRDAASAGLPPSSAGELRHLPLNLGSLASVARAAGRFAEAETRLDVLWNATTAVPAVEPRPDRRTSDGLEVMIGVHCAAAVHLTSLLGPQLGVSAALVASGDHDDGGRGRGRGGGGGGGGGARTRVVWNLSSAVDRAPTNGLDLDLLAAAGAGATPPLTRWDSTHCFAVSQAGVYMLAREMAPWFSNWGVVSVIQIPDHHHHSPGSSSHPGTNGTGAATDREAARTAFYAGLSPDVTPDDNGAIVLPGGRVFLDDEVLRGDIVRASRPVDAGGLGYSKRLWDWCREQCEPFRQVRP